MADSDSTQVHDTAQVRVSVPGAKGRGDARAYLVMIVGDEIGRKVPLDGTALVIGRTSEAGLPVNHDSVSRHHARIDPHPGGYAITDLDSTNGTFVNNASVQGSETLRDGDQIRVGRTILKFIQGNNVEAQYHEEIYAMMTTDGLTRVHNKRYFDGVLDREAARARRYERPFAIILFDIDHFKQINDTHGHLAGDEVLRVLGGALRPRVRSNDTVARIGGEEFAVILPETDHAGGLSFAGSLRLMVEETRFAFEGKHIPVTVSVGVAAWQPNSTSGQDVLKLADTKMYEAKTGGRNRVCG